MILVFGIVDIKFAVAPPPNFIVFFDLITHDTMGNDPVVCGKVKEMTQVQENEIHMEK